MQLSEESFAILSILCLLSPDRGGNMCLRDRQQLNRLQVTFFSVINRVFTAPTKNFRRVETLAIKDENFVRIGCNNILGNIR